MSDYGSANAKCPFYKGDAEKSIKCEGSVANLCLHQFRSRSKKAEMFADKCCAEYEECPYFALLFEKYNV